MSNHGKKLSKFTVASVIATACDGFVYFLITQVVSSDPFTLGLSAAVAAIVGGIVHFSMARKWVFQSTEPIPPQAFRYIAASGAGALLHGTLVGALSTLTGGRVAWMISKVLIYFCWTYPTSTYFVFRSKQNAGNV